MSFYHKVNCLLQLVWDANVLSIIALVFYSVCSVYSKHNDACCIVLCYLYCYALYHSKTIHASIWPQWCLNTMNRQHAYIGHTCSTELIGISMPAITPSETQWYLLQKKYLSSQEYAMLHLEGFFILSRSNLTSFTINGSKTFVHL